MRKQNQIEWFKSLPIKHAAQVKIEFACQVNDFLIKNNITKKELAVRLGTSQAWASKMLRGDANFTINTMCDVAQAIECKIHIHMEEKNYNVQWSRVRQEIILKPGVPSTRLKSFPQQYRNDVQASKANQFKYAKDDNVEFPLAA